MNDFNQLCGALSALKSAGADLPWVEISEQMRDMGRRLGIAQIGDTLTESPPTGSNDPVHAEISTMLRTYRTMCRKLGLIGRGELFNDDDCVPLI